MSLDSILGAIDQQIAKLEAAKRLLQDASAGSHAVKISKGKVGRPRKKRTLSAEARARIAAAQKKRWAKQKKEK